MELTMDLRARRVTAEMRRSVVPLEAILSEDFLMVTCPYGVFQIEQGYPFRPPKLLINGEEDHIRLLYRRQTNMKEFMKYYKLIELCICCKNLKCAWSPCYGLKDVMDEYVQYTRRINVFSRLKVVIANLPFDDNINSIIVSYF